MSDSEVKFKVLCGVFFLLTILFASLFIIEGEKSKAWKLAAKEECKTINAVIEVSNSCTELLGKITDTPFNNLTSMDCRWTG